MTKFAQPALLLLAVVICSAQSTKPSVQKCRADQSLWLSKLDPPDPIYDDDPRLPGWDGEDFQYQEMQKCNSVDPEHRRDYDRVRSEIVADRTIRIGRFMRRHNLLEDFLRENPALRKDSPKSARAAKMIAYLTNHRLFVQFKNEDAAVHKSGLTVR